MMNTFKAVLGWIERLSEWSGKLSSWFVVALILSISYDVFMRYVLNAPTLWSFDVSYMLGGSVYVMGLAYVFLRDENIRVDIISSRFPPKMRLIIDLAFAAALFFPLILFILKTSIDVTIHSWEIKEKASVTIFYPPLYPFRTLISLAFVLLLLQGVASFCRNLLRLVEGKA
jgi:TRAP-type mannitol/chloroaromatic compound transport system permease small subunit